MAALYKEQLGAQIRRRRLELDMTQKDLAEEAGIEESQTVSRWERGLNAPEDLESVARALKTTAGAMLAELDPAHRKRRTRAQPTDGSQLDHIESMLTEILAILRPPADVEPEAPSDDLLQPPATDEPNPDEDRDDESGPEEDVA